MSGAMWREGRAVGSRAMRKKASGKQKETWDMLQTSFRAWRPGLVSVCITMFPSWLSFSGNSEWYWKSLIRNVQEPMRNYSPSLILLFGLGFLLPLYCELFLSLSIQHSFLESTLPSFI